MAEIPIPLSAQNLARLPIKGADGVEHILLMRVPTQLERERLNLKLYELGVVEVSRSTRKATIVNALFDIYDYEKADELSAFLDDYWARDEADAANMARWAEQNFQRLMDRTAGAPPRAAEEQPLPTVRPVERYKVQGIIDDLEMQSGAYRRMAARAINYVLAVEAMKIRIAVAGVIDNTIDLETEPSDAAIITEASLQRLVDRLGQEGIRELREFNDEQYGITKAEEKNSVLPAGGAPPESGSDETSRSLGSESNGGEWTGSSISPTPSDASAPTTSRSSTSTSGKREGRNKGSGRTEART